MGPDPHASASRIRIRDFGHMGLRLACREGTVDERAAQGWLEWVEQGTPIPTESPDSEVILDVGAHIGGFSLLAASLAPKRRVIAVEPCRANYEMLVRNVALNGMQNVETIHLALSHQTGRTLLYHDPTGNWGHTITKELGVGGEQVETRTLSDFLCERGVRGCALAKLNCEGSEFPILMTTPITTLREIGQMQILYHTNLVDASHSLANLERRLADAGFELERHGSAIHGRISARRRPQSCGPLG